MHPTVKQWGATILFHPNPPIPALHLCKGRMTVIVAHNIGVEQFAVFARHVKGGVSEKLLKGEGIAVTIEKMDTL